MPCLAWPIIVGGCFRSGTSLVRRLLNAHSRLHCGPEVKFFRDFYGDYFHDPLKHLRFSHSARTLLPEKALLEILGQAFIHMHERAAARASKPRWADKNPENVLYLKEWQQLLGDRWLFIHVVRNPLDTLASIKERPFPLTIPRELEARIRMYLRYLDAGRRFGATFPDRYYCLSYERLVSSPWEVLENLMRWLGEHREVEQMNFNQASHQSGLEDPKIAHTKEIKTDRLGRWQNTLSPAEAKTIWRETAAFWEQIDPEHRYIFLPPALEDSFQ